MKKIIWLYVILLGIAINADLWIISIGAYFHNGIAILDFNKYNENFFESFVLFPANLVVMCYVLYQLDKEIEGESIR